jgi:hypothetical protein
MGYRSDVAYIIEFASYEDRDTYVNLKLALAPDDPEHQAMLECEYESQRRPIITFKAGDVKWYPSYTEVIAHTRIYEGVKEVFETARWRFIALGEDGQTEENADDDGGNLYDDLYVVHSVQCTF